jgi:hypothetical protein
VKAELGLRRSENGEHGSGTTEVKQTATAGGDMLVVAGAGAEKGAEFVVASAEALRGSEALKAPHTSCSAFHAPMILLQSVILVGAGPMHDPPAERRAARTLAPAGDVFGISDTIHPAGRFTMPSRLERGCE